MTRQDCRAGVIILAAGCARRFGRDKRRALLPDGVPLLEATLSQVPSGAGKLLVLHPGDDELGAYYAGRGWAICMPADASQGMGHSLASAIRQVPADWEGALLGLGDMPFVRTDTYAALLEALAHHDIVYPVYRGRRGNPVGFRRRFFPELSRLTGDRGARGLLAKHRDNCREVAVDDPGILRDIDTETALEEGFTTDP